MQRRVAGEIAVRGPQVMLGYWNRPKETAEVLEDGWMHLGDAGTMDEDDFVYLLDRLKDMIVSGGENVYSREVENAVLSHPAVRDCAVVVVPWEELGVAVHVIVVFKDGMSASQEDILAHCRRLSAGYNCPRSMEVREDLPLSATGKILKAELRKRYWADNDRQIN